MFQLRVRLAIVATGVLVLILLARLAFLQDRQPRLLHNAVARESLKDRTHRTPRGLIFSRKGITFAENRPSFSLT